MSAPSSASVNMSVSSSSSAVPAAIINKGGRPASKIVSEFGPAFVEGGFKMNRRNCKHCGASVTSTSQKMQTHFDSCEKVPHGIGLMPRGLVKSRHAAEHHNDQTGSESNDPPPRKRHAVAPAWCDSMTAEQQLISERLMATAVHRTCGAFNMFQNRFMRAWISSLRPTFKVPHSDRIGGDMMVFEYRAVQAEAIQRVKQFRSICLTLDACTTKTSKQILNAMACGPQAYFIEHFKMHLDRETADNLLAKCIDLKSRLRISLYGDPDDLSNVEPPVSLDEPLWTLCSDSPSVMTKLRRISVQSGHFVFAFGCASHGTHNLCMDIINQGLPKVVLSTVVFMVKGITNVHLLSTMYDVVCRQKLGKEYVLILFTPSRWTTSTYALARMLKVKPVLTAMPHMIDFEDQFRHVAITDVLRSHLTDLDLWQNIKNLHDLLIPLNAVTGHLEGDSSTFSDVYACFLSVAHHFWTFDENILTGMGLSRHQLVELVHRRFGTIYTASHALAFVTDSLYHSMHTNLRVLHGSAFVELGQGSINTQCRTALTILSEGNVDYEGRLQEQFAYYRSIVHAPDSYFIVSRFLKPALSWGQVDQKEYEDLAPLLVKVHGNPTGAVGGERNHKTTKRVQSKLRVRLKTSNVERQVAISYNSAVMERILEPKRVTSLWKHLASLGSAEVEALGPESSDEEEIFEDQFQNVDINLGVHSMLERALDAGEWYGAEE